MIGLNKKGQSIDCPAADMEVLIVCIGISEGTTFMAGGVRADALELGECICPRAKAYPASDGGLIIPACENRSPGITCLSIESRHGGGYCQNDAKADQHSYDNASNWLGHTLFSF